MPLTGELKIGPVCGLGSDPPGRAWAAAGAAVTAAASTEAAITALAAGTNFATRTPEEDTKRQSTQKALEVPKAYMSYGCP
ncbi:hypothetical protein Airi01_049570 [Actinoallomurus iriomotensis]|uniref:Uncharacterized protein n=1 Tax=Actinoallomurus iriomotensis TaxID=478107 RepID=A0A9W6RMR8_9ACTN|nr:hypothetical protein Airi01_049570 [Actinoallomurus iriomotensis]